MYLTELAPVGRGSTSDAYNDLRGSLREVEKAVLKTLALQLEQTVPGLVAFVYSEKCDLRRVADLFHGENIPKPVKLLIKQRGESVKKICEEMYFPLLMDALVNDFYERHWLHHRRRILCDRPREDIDFVWQEMRYPRFSKNIWELEDLGQYVYTRLTRLGKALMWDSRELVELILEHGKPDLELRFERHDGVRFSPMGWCIVQQDGRYLDLLLKHGVDPNKKFLNDGIPDSPLNWSVRIDSCRSMLQLEDAGGKVQDDMIQLAFDSNSCKVMIYLFYEHNRSQYFRQVALLRIRVGKLINNPMEAIICGIKPNLTTIKLGRRFRKVPETMRYGFENLSTLDLSQSYVSSLPWWIFRFSGTLQNIIWSDVTPIARDVPKLLKRLKKMKNMTESIVVLLMIRKFRAVDCPYVAQIPIPVMQVIFAYIRWSRERIIKSEKLE